MTFSGILAALGLGPKTLDQARGTLAEAATTLNSVSALFTAAGLNLETMLAAGPESLKAHIESLSAKALDVEAAAGRETLLKEQVATLTADLNSATHKFSVIGGVLAPVGITATTKPEEYSALLSKHVKEQAALELAKTGHAPVPAATEQQIAAVAKKMTRAEHYAIMEKLPQEEQSAYFAKHLRAK